MSETQSLATIEQQQLVAANPGLTLLEGYQTINQGAQPDAYRMDDEDREDLDEVKIRPLRLKMDGTTGRFTTTEDPKDAKGWETLDQAVILTKLDDSQVLFPKLDQQKKQIWPEGSTEWPAYLCRADSVHGIPKLHPELTEAQVQIAVRLRVNGAINVNRDPSLPLLNCTTCPHAQFNGDVKPNCAKAFNLLVFESHTKEPALLQVKGTSLKFADRHMATYKRRDRALFSDLVSIGSKQVVEDGTKWQVMTFTPGAEIGTAATPAFREMLKMMRPLLREEMRSGRNVVLGTDEDVVHGHEPPPAAPVGDALDPIDPRDPLPDGTPSEFDLF